METGWLPEAWQEAFRRDAEMAKPMVADPLPERRLARLLAAWIAAGLVFLLLPGTLLGVWNLVGISSRRQAEAVSTAWIQAHGHAQLFGWVVTFILGISMHVFPKFRGGRLRSIPLGWAMLALWTLAVASRWLTGVRAFHWQLVWPVSAAAELAVALLLIWQCLPSGRSHRTGQAWEILVFTGFGGLVLTLAWQLILTLRPLPAPQLPLAEDRLLISMALWIFCLPLVMGYSAKFFPGLMGTQPPSRAGAWLAVALLAPVALNYAWAALAAVAAGCWSVRVFHPAPRRPKTDGVDRLYPIFARVAFAWLIVSAILGLHAGAPGMLGASRHAFTVGFLATLIFSIGPRILPSFLSSRELWSPGLMRVSLLLLTTGCTLRVASEPLAYGDLVPVAWQILPASAMIELSAVALFVLNLAKTLASPLPVWFDRQQLNAQLSLYWVVTSYPETRKLLAACGLATLSRSCAVPKNLTLNEAAQADGVPVERVLERLGGFFESRLARALRGGEGR